MIDIEIYQGFKHLASSIVQLGSTARVNQFSFDKLIGTFLQLRTFGESADHWGLRNQRNCGENGEKASSCWAQDTSVGSL